ncbi:uncharacterized protein LOC126899427 isoform X2 [Daktulosphaira vitifoliae]|uniref:uncharacterized protein LOC126899427 isoform X2 n=1 Tax=Daktulosphaira vitifoliae TaxID=58002 RepID=UPI0021A9B9B3|nr:uncharacterized protein LOC126899427 isoform X2 [Daktulosphaira vitifoliae]XP_050530340.1 uncharacterized protein LOC126899427 isoform X2 [Daktulosphaira vitifoliae]
MAGDGSVHLENVHQSITSCSICLKKMTNDVYATVCCEKPVHFECLDKYFDTYKTCSSCNGIPIKCCSICQVNSTDDSFKSKCCGKRFHYKCIQKCFDKSKTCPQCIQYYESCSICQVNSTEDSFKSKCCGKIFHYECIENCFDKSKTCRRCIHYYEKCELCENYINDDDFYKFSCCKYQVHLKCLEDIFVYVKMSGECPICHTNLIPDVKGCGKNCGCRKTGLKCSNKSGNCKGQLCLNSIEIDIE